MKNIRNLVGTQVYNKLHRNIIEIHLRKGALYIKLVNDFKFPLNSIVKDNFEMKAVFI